MHIFINMNWAYTYKLWQVFKQNLDIQILNYRIWIVQSNTVIKLHKYIVYMSVTYADHKLT